MIQLYTDASYGIESGVSGWGCVLVNEGEMISFASGCTTNIVDVFNSEAHAIKMGIINFMMECEYPQTLIVWCDNIAVCGMLMRQNRDYPHFDDMRSQVLGLLHKNGIPYHFNYVPRVSNKFAVKVDKLAKKQLQDNE